MNHKMKKWMNERDAISLRVMQGIHPLWTYKAKQLSLMAFLAFLVYSLLSLPHSSSVYYLSCFNQSTHTWSLMKVFLYIFRLPPSGSPSRLVHIRSEEADCCGQGRAGPAINSWISVWLWMWRAPRVIHRFTLMNITGASLNTLPPLSKSLHIVHSSTFLVETVLWSLQARLLSLAFTVVIVFSLVAFAQRLQPATQR